MVMGRPTIYSPEENRARIKARHSAWVENNKAHLARYDHQRYEERKRIRTERQRVTITGNTLVHLCLE